jgi:hypothetical protein
MKTVIWTDVKEMNQNLAIINETEKSKEPEINQTVPEKNKLTSENR